LNRPAGTGDFFVSVGSGAVGFCFGAQGSGVGEDAGVGPQVGACGDLCVFGKVAMKGDDEISKAA
jgi:hypothetical protein